MSDYSLTQSGILRLLQEGKAPVDKEDWFFEAISQAAEKIGEKRHASLTVDLRRTVEAHRDWRNDVKDLIDKANRIPNSTTPCNKKQAAFLCYWLRRRQIVRDLKGNQETDELLKDYPNEYIAARICLSLLYYTEFFPKGCDPNSQLKAFGASFPEDFFQDFVVMLRFKNVSPHGIYLVFKALVTPSPVVPGQVIRAVN